MGFFFSLRHRDQTGSGAHLTSYPMGTWGFFPGGKAAASWSWPLTSSWGRFAEWINEFYGGYKFSVMGSCTAWNKSNDFFACGVYFVKYEGDMSLPGHSLKLITLAEFLIFIWCSRKIIGLKNPSIEPMTPN